MPTAGRRKCWTRRTAPPARGSWPRCLRPGCAAVLMPESTWNRARKNGTWISMGRQAENGLVPCFLYIAICSCAMAWRESWSVLPLYLSCSFFRSGCSSRIRRWASSCFRNTGIRAARITSTSPMMDSVHVQPSAAGMPTALSPSWKPTMMTDTSHLNGNMIDSKVHRDPHPPGAAKLRRNGLIVTVPGSGDTAKAGETKEPPESQGFRGFCLVAVGRLDLPTSRL